MKSILDSIVKFYLKNSKKSGDFNGIPLWTLMKKYNRKNLKKEILRLINNEYISIHWGKGHPNVHIKAWYPQSKEIQIAYAESIDWNIQISEITDINDTTQLLRFVMDPVNVCVYPESKSLSVCDLSYLNDRPFTQKMALGMPELEFAVFDLSVLEQYRNDPRYGYVTSAAGGNFYWKDGYEGKESDKTYIQTYGFCHKNYNDINKTERAVAAYYVYLSRLSPEHQQVWNSKLSVDRKSYNLHRDYALTTAGHWPEGIDIFELCLTLLKHINHICSLHEKKLKPLFRSDYSNIELREFSFLLRPTEKEFNDFICCLDVILSDNIDKKHFEGHVVLENEEARSDGKIIIQPRGTISMLEEMYGDIEPEKLKIFKEVRKLRSKASHRSNDSVYDQQYYRDQVRIMKEVLGALYTIFTYLQTEPGCKSYQLPAHFLKAGINDR